MTMIPPATIDIQGDDAGFVRTVAEVKAMLADLAKTTAQTRIGANAKLFETSLAAVKVQLSDLAGTVTSARIGATSKPFQADLATVKAELLDLGRKVNRARIGADAAVFWQDIARLKAEVKAMSPLDVDVDANISRALAKIAALRAALDSASLDAISPKYGPSIAAALAGGAGGGEGGGGLSAWLAKVFTPSVGRFGRVGGPLGAGLALAGLSVEHMAVAGIDMAATASAGLMGGLLKALAGGSVLAVGMGTDLAGLGQAAGDIKMINTDTNNLNNAIAVYGKNSAAAQTAQKQLNADLQSFSAIARGPVTKSVSAIQAFVKAFDAATGPAEAKGANIITEVIKDAQKFVGIIGKFASINMTKINAGLQPLLKWLTSMGTVKNPGGMRIFTELEQLFTKHLPKGMSTFTNALESLFKIIGMVAPKTGGFMASLNRFFTDLNTQLSQPKSHDKTVVNNLLQDWNAFYGFLKLLVKDTAGLFTHGKDQRTGLAIFQTLSGFLTELASFEKSASGSKGITTVFKASKGEILAFFNLLPPIVKSFAAIMTTLGPAMHTGGAAALKAVGATLDAVSSALTKIANVKGLSGAVKALGVVAGAGLSLGVLTALLGKIPLISKAFDTLGTALKGIGVKGLASLAGVLSKLPLVGGLFAKLQTALSGSGKVSFSGSVSSFAAAVADFVRGVGRFTGLGGGGGAGAGEEGAMGGLLANFAKLASVVGAAALAFGGLTALLNKILGNHINPVKRSIHTITHPKQSLDTTLGPFKAAWDAIFGGGGASSTGATSIESMASTLGTKVSALISKGDWKKATSDLERTLHMTKKQAETTVRQLGKDMGKEGAGAVQTLLKNMAEGFLQNKAASKNAAKAGKDMGSSTVRALKNATGVHSPSTITRQIGTDMVQGLVNGMKADLAKLVAEDKRIAEQSLKTLRTFTPDYTTLGSQWGAAVAAGIRSQIGNVTAAAQALGGAAHSGIASSMGSGPGLVQQLRVGTSW